MLITGVNDGKKSYTNFFTVCLYFIWQHFPHKDRFCTYCSTFVVDRSGKLMPCVIKTGQQSWSLTISVTCGLGTNYWRCQGASKVFNNSAGVNNTSNRPWVVNIFSNIRKSWKWRSGLWGKLIHRKKPKNRNSDDTVSSKHGLFKWTYSSV